MARQMPGPIPVDQGSLPVPRRHTPYFGQPDYRIYELNKRLQQRTEVSLNESDNLWWDAFATEFFEDDASLTLAFCLEDGPKRYSVLHDQISPFNRIKIHCLQQSEGH
jgi:hypothetical protein